MTFGSAVANGGGNPIPECGITDTFTRTVADGWGTSDAGLVWQLLRGNNATAPYSVNGTQAILDSSLTGGDGDPGMSLHATFTDPVLVEFQMTISQPVPDSAEPQFWLAYANDHPGGLYYIGLDIWIPLSGTGGVGVNAFDGSSPSGLPDWIDGNLAFDTPYVFKMLKTGSEIKAKWWLASGTEPADWMVADGDPATPRLVEQAYFFVPATSTVIAIDSLDISGVNRCSVTP